MPASKRSQGRPSVGTPGWCWSRPTAPSRFQNFDFSTGDTLLFGRESAGSPGELYRAADASVRVPMARGLRSLNVVTAAAMILTEAMRQTGAWEKLD